mgnify:CR=1 FL=1
MSCPEVSLFLSLSIYLSLFRSKAFLHSNWSSLRVLSILLGRCIPRGRRLFLLLRAGGVWEDESRPSMWCASLPPSLRYDGFIYVPSPSKASLRTRQMDPFSRATWPLRPPYCSLHLVKARGQLILLVPNDFSLFFLFPVANDRRSTFACSNRFCACGGARGMVYLCAVLSFP